MAYRFVLEVPEAYRRPAEIVVGSVPDTQILVTRLSFADGVDEPFAALAIACEHVRVVDAIYRWMKSEGSPRSRIVLLNGQRLALAEHSVDDVVAAIRTDQPWGERNIPHIGDHIEEKVVIDPSANQEVAQTTATPSVTIEKVNMITINAMDLRRAEEFYREFFGMEIVARATFDADGKYQMLSDDYDWERALVTETLADETFMRNGDLILGVRRVGVGARLGRTTIDSISVQLDAESYRRLKAKVLVNSFELLGESQSSFKFRDPMGVPWEITLAGLMPKVLKDALGS